MGSDVEDAKAGLSGAGGAAGEGKAPAPSKAGADGGRRRLLNMNSSQAVEMGLEP